MGQSLSSRGPMAVRMMFLLLTMVTVLLVIVVGEVESGEDGEKLDRVLGLRIKVRSSEESREGQYTSSNSSSNSTEDMKSSSNSIFYLSGFSSIAIISLFL